MPISLAPDGAGRPGALKSTIWAPALTRSRVCQQHGGLVAYFVAECCFQVIYFNSNISLVPLIETCARPTVETVRLTHAVKNAWARRQTGNELDLQGI